VVRNNDAADALRPSIGVECVICHEAMISRLSAFSFASSESFWDTTGTGSRTLLFNILSLSRPRPFGHRLCEKSHEFAITVMHL
jgi:hypothetical protein